MRLHFIQNHQHPPGDGICQTGVWLNFDEVDGERLVVGTKNQMAGLQVEIAEHETRVPAHCIECEPARAVRRERNVVAVDDGVGVGEEDGLHGLGLDGGDAHGDKALPHAASAGGVGSRRFDGGSG